MYLRAKFRSKNTSVLGTNPMGKVEAPTHGLQTNPNKKKNKTKKREGRKIQQGIAGQLTISFVQQMRVRKCEVFFVLVRTSRCCMETNMT